jgi:membrane protease YdiL (CAAX protease family)
LGRLCGSHSVAGVLSEKPWRIEAVLQLCLALFFFLLLGATVVALLRQFGGARFQAEEQFLNVLIGTLTLHGSMLVVIMIFLRQHRISWRDAFGLTRKDRWRSVGIAVMVGCIATPLVCLLQGVSISVLTRVGWTPEEQAAVALVKHSTLWWKRAYLAFFAIMLAPVVEEFIFRGVLFPLLLRSGYRRTAWLGSSLAFALVHFNVATFLPLFVLALVLASLYETLDTLLAPIVVHALFNAANFILLIQADWVFQSRP